MKSRTVTLLASIATVCILIVEPTEAQKPATTKQPADILKPGWETIDERLLFLFVRLASVETSLDATEKAIQVYSRKQLGRASNAKRAEKNNELMDRKGGGPVRWSEFYGRTAERFFYHPVDRNTYYHTITVLGLTAIPQGGTTQSLPLNQRPPQFDYIYKANRDSKARAEREVADLENRIDDLQSRRRALEEEQSALWCEIAFRSVAHYDLDRKPLYRFQPKVADDASRDVSKRAEAMKAAAKFMQRAMAIVNAAQKDQSITFSQVKDVISKARDELNDNWLKHEIKSDDVGTNEGKFVALAKKLEDVAANLADSYSVSIDGDRFQDEQRKERFRGLLQKSLEDYSQILLAFDEVTQELTKQWQFAPNLDAAIEVEQPIKNIPEGAPPPPAAKQPVGAPRRQPVGQIADKLRQKVTLRSPYGKDERKCEYKNPDGTWNVIEGPDNEGRIRVACLNCGHIYPSANREMAALGKTSNVISTCRNSPTLTILTVEQAVAKLLEKVSVPLDYNTSRKNAGDILGREITPNISNTECGTALSGILEPFGLSYVLDGDKVILTRRK
jgi:hypothetical protein